MMVCKAITLGTPEPKTRVDRLIFCFPLSFVIFHTKICLDHKAFQTWQPIADVKPKCDLKVTKPTSQVLPPDFQFQRQLNPLSEVVPLCFIVFNVSFFLKLV